MKKKLILIMLLIFILAAAGCTNKAVKGTNLSNTSDSNSSKVEDVKKEDDKIIQEAIDTMDDLKLDEINDGILDDSELDSILKDKDNPVSDISTK